jgi:cyanophycinase-like exopeptidase
MSPIALHGGGEFMTGDEPFVLAVLEAAVGHARRRAGGGGVTAAAVPAGAVPGTDLERPGVVRIAIVPAAAGQGRPELSGAHAVAAFERVAAAAGLEIAAETVLVVDAASAADPRLAARLAAADAIVLPGGEPAVIAAVLTDTPAWDAIRSALADGAILAGASAGAMVLAPVTWTSRGVMRGLGLVPGIVVMPHADAALWAEFSGRFDEAAAIGLGVLGLAERTAVVSEGPSLDAGSGHGEWLVVGEGEVRWLPPGGALVVARAGDHLPLTA